MDKLKTCPFCGGEAQVTIYGISDRTYSVHCQSCFAMMGHEERTWSGLRGKLFYSTEEEAVDAWNKRYKEG